MQPHQLRGLLIAGIGLLLMLASGLAVADFRQRIAPSRFLVQPMNVVVTPDEANIVVGSTYARLHVVAANGRVQRDWKLPTEGGAFRVELAADDRIRVATEKTRLLLEYTLDGELVSEREDAQAYARLGAEHEHGFTAASGNQYLIEDGRLRRVGSDDEQVLVEGFATHAAITVRMSLMGGGLLIGVVLLIAGFVSTGRRRSAA